MYIIHLVRRLLNIFDFFQQRKIIKFFKNKFLKELVIFDVGSHFGETVKLFYKNFQIKKIHCFEASPENYKKLNSRLTSLIRKYKSTKILLY